MLRNLAGNRWTGTTKLDFSCMFCKLYCNFSCGLEKVKIKIGSEFGCSKNCWIWQKFNTTLLSKLLSLEILLYTAQKIFQWSAPLLQASMMFFWNIAKHLKTFVKTLYNPVAGKTTKWTMLYILWMFDGRLSLQKVLRSHFLSR